MAPNLRPVLAAVSLALCLSSGGLSAARPAAPVVKTYRVAAASRPTIWVNHEDPRLASTDVSAIVTGLSAQPIVVERSMYLDSAGQIFGAGHDSAGVIAPATRWFLAEGARGSFFDLFILLANPGSSPAVVDAAYLLRA
jgi:hypothetical protein